MNQFLVAFILCCLSQGVSSVASPMDQQQPLSSPPPTSSAPLPLTSEANAGLPWLQQQLQALRDDCHQSGPLGLISGQIRDWQLTASSTYPQEWDSGCHDRYARLYQPNGLGWCAKYKSASEWLQVDLGVIAKVTGVMTQGRNDGSEWVTSFMLSHSFDGRHWSYVIDQYGNQKVFEGNTDSYSAKYSYLDEPVFARFVRFHTVQWNRHPSMRVELIGCQVCNVPLSLPPSAKITASSEKWQADGSSCQADSAYIFTNKAWCAKTDNNNQWLQFDIGPPTLVTGLITRGRGDEGRNHWVKRFRLSYSNDSNVWYFYKDNSHLDAKRTWDVSSGKKSSVNSSSSSSSSSSTNFIPNRQSLEGLEFGANSNKHEERYHFLNSPFTARYVRFHPVDWHRHISMRAGLLGCPYKGECVNGFMRINDESPCVENLAYHKDSFVNKRHLKRHIRNQWIRGQASRAVDGRADQDINNCTILDNYHVDKPTWMVDLGRKVKVAGIKIQTWTGNETGSQDMSTSNRDYMHNLEKLFVYVDNKAGKDKIDHPGNICGSVSRQNDALYRPKLHVPCGRPIRGRYVYIEAWGMADRSSRLFSAVLCEVWVYE